MRMLAGPTRGLRAASPMGQISMTKPQMLAYTTRRMPHDTPAASRGSSHGCSHPEFKADIGYQDDHRSV
jgi:hypothetical protein